MRRSVSPLFAVIVIVVALVLGALWSMMRSKADQAREAELDRVLQLHADQGRRSGRMGGGGRRGMGGGTREPAPGGEAGTGEEDRSTGGEPAGE
jgi:type II secretory pathway pseudopilin PulG